MTEPIDARVQKLVAALNRFPGITTIGSCGGHPDPGPRRWPQGTCYVKFRVTETDGGLFSVQVLAWLLRDFRQAGLAWRLVRLTPPAGMQEPEGEMTFALEGLWGTDPDALADFLDVQRKQLVARVPRE